MDYIPSKFESVKFSQRKEQYYQGLSEILSLGFSSEDLLHYFPSFTGHMTLARYLALYEVYKMTLGVAGHIAELGVYKAAGTLLFAKLTQIFEPESLTLVHGFDWFEGSKPTAEEPNVCEGSYKEDYERIKKLITAQNLQNIVHLHKLDLSKDLTLFFQANPYMQFKLIFCDAGLYDIVKHCIENFWHRLTPGGIMIFDQFNHELAPGESRAIKELLPNEEIKIFPWCWMPNAYIIKK